MKKVLSLLLVGALMMFGGCGGSKDNDDEAKKARVEEMLGEWSVTVDLGNTDLNKELYFAGSLKNDDGDWVVGYTGENFTDMCIFDEEENAYIAVTVYFDEISGKATGEMEAYRFPSIVNENEISGVFVSGNDKTEEYSNEYHFDGTRNYMFSATAKYKKSMKKSLKSNEKIELTEEQKEKIREAAYLLRNK